LIKKLYEYKLWNFNEDEEKILHTLWKEVLSEDNWWHFFYEGSYTVIRVTRKSRGKVSNFLKRKGVDCRYAGKWIDNIKTTRESQNEFLYIFHGYSELAMKSIGKSNKDIEFLLDRVVHCFMNNMSSNLRRETTGALWEPMLIAKNAIERAVFIGRILEHHDKKSE